ncbi:MAG: CCA tRNA nucleotidyltransferase [Pirellulales bacterium]
MIPVVDPAETRRFALDIVQRLRGAGYEALWAGGCVRDQLLGREPKDYDVATSARPDEVRAVFGKRHTIPVGAAFGVITVLGRHGAGAVEVATFRRDATYSDGRHPDSVTFSSAAEDALRRDFTINGMFYDPLAEQVVDYVGGQEDLAAGVVRAIRDPRERFHEDKLRMLRAIRFATIFGFTLETQTLAAIRQLAAEVVIVSAERIAAELRRLLPHPARRRGLELLSASRLLPVLLPELAGFDPESAWRDADSDATWRATLELLDALPSPTFPVALAALIRPVATGGTAAETICRRWRLSNDETARVDWLLTRLDEVLAARDLPWPRLQRLLIAPGIGELLSLAEGVERTSGLATPQSDYCRELLAQPAAQLNPPPLVTGDDLRRAGLRPGPMFRELLEAIRDRQLTGELTTAAEALEFALGLGPDRSAASGG